MSFTGVYQHAIDAKGRTSLPSRFREVLSAQGADKLFITTDILDPCLQAYAPGQWTAFTERVAKLSAFDPVVRQLVRTFVAAASPIRAADARKQIGDDLERSCGAANHTLAQE